MASGKILIILFLAASLRFFWLAKVPPALDWDEAAIGWNAKTIWESRLDEFGTRLPLSFRSFGDYKAPLYIYLTAPIVGIFGANEISVRLVSVLAGIVSIYLIYLIGLELKNYKLGITAAALLAISPWHLMLSRPAFEPNLALMFILGGIILFLKSLTKSWLLVLATISFGLSLYSYQSPKIFVPALGLGMIYVYRRQIFKKEKFKILAISALVLILLLRPLFKDWTQGGSSRFQGTTLFYQQDINVFPALIKNYLIHFSPLFLFWGGQDIPRVQVQQSGPFLLATAPFLILGLYFLFKNRREQWAQFLLWWLIIGPIPAMIGWEVPHPIRTFNWLPALILIIALGLQKYLKPGIIFLLGLNFIFFAYHYFLVYPVYSAPDWQYGYKEAAAIAREYEDKVEKIILTSAYGQPYVFTYFYQNRGAFEVLWGGMSKYLFREINWNEDQFKPNVLLIGSPEEIPADLEKVIKTINFPDGQPAFRVVQTKP